MYLSCHGCMAIDDGICDGLDSCVALDLGHNRISDDGLRTLLDKVPGLLVRAYSHISSANPQLSVDHRTVSLALWCILLLSLCD